MSAIDAPGNPQSFDEARAAVAAGMSPAEAARALVATMTPEERLWCLDGDAPTWAGLDFLVKGGYHLAPFLGAQVERVGLPGIAFADGPRGAVVGNATAFPVSMARGATWDPALEERIGEAIGRELRVVGANLTGAVCVNVLRHPAWGRAQETYGEDPFHVGELGAALTRGLQRHLMACVKHFACNSMENARFSVDIEVDEVDLHEVYLPHFRRIIDEGAASVMSAYNSVNGEWCGENRVLLTDILRGEWGFEGFVISDWIFGLRDAARSLAAGLDIEMPYRMVRAQGLPPALESGSANWADVDEAVTRIIATLLRFDGVLSTSPDPSVVGCPEHRALAREAAARSVVLLKNQPVADGPVLPLAPGTSVAVIGGLASTVNIGDGGSSDVWDLACDTVLDGIRGAIERVTHHDGSEPEAAAELAAQADVAVVVVGYTFVDEGEYIGATDPALGALFPATDDPELVASFERWVAARPPTTVPPRNETRGPGFATGGDRSSLRLKDADVELIRTVAAANPSTVVVIQAGSAVVMTEWVDLVPAVVIGWYGGSAAGAGLADVLTGAVAPSGRLPFSIPVAEQDLPEFDRDATRFRYDRWFGWWHLERTGRSPAFPFGFGLGYTSFELAEAAVAEPAGAPGAGDDLIIRARVRNLGERDGADVVQVYSAPATADRPPRLVGFARAEVPAGGVAEVLVRLPGRALEIRDPDSHSWVRPDGPVELTVARFAGDPAALRLSVTQ